MRASSYVLQDGQRVVLIGDSITDCDRRGAHAPLGDGYVRLVASLSAGRYPDRRIAFLNRGISGDTVRHLAARWEADVLAERPDWLSVSIGVNDVWRQLDHGGPGVLVDEYAATYRELLESTRARLPGCGFILMTPGILSEDLAAEGNRMLRPYVEVVERLAGDLNAFCVPVRAAFERALADGRGRNWTTDGVHPNADGHALMALTWLETLSW